MLSAAFFGAIAAKGNAQPPELPVLVDGLQGWISTTRGKFLFGDGTTTPGHGKAVHEARNVEDQSSLFSQASPGLRPTWDATTFDVPCIRSDGTQYLVRNSALTEPGLIIVAVALDAGITGNDAITGARSTETPGGDPLDDAWALRREVGGARMQAVAPTTAAVSFANTPEILGEKLVVMLEIVGNQLEVWQVGAVGNETLLGTLPAADGEQVLLAKYYNDVVAAIMEGAIFEFAQYAPAPTRAERRLLVQYFQGVIWPSVTPPVAADPPIDAGQIQQGTNKSIDVLTPSSGSSLVLASIDEQPLVGSLSVSGSDVVITVPPGAAPGLHHGWYCLRSDVTGERLVDFGRISFEVTAGVSAILPEDEPLPAADVTVNTNVANFTTDYAAAALAAGTCTHLVLADGNYGAVTLDRNKAGTTAYAQGKPIVIRAQNLLGATFSSLVVAGTGHIVSGASIGSDGGGARLEPQGNNFRFTRGHIVGGGYTVNIGSSASGILIDHSELTRTQDRMFNCDNPKDQRDIIIARNWVHDLSEVAGGFLGGGDMFGWSSQNMYREKHIDGIIRLNYCGPGEGPNINIADYIHDKVSHMAYVSNYWDTWGTSLVMRFGVRKRFIGNYAPNANLRQWDDLSWIYGNKLDKIQCPAGRSGYYDETKNLVDSVGGFHACTRCRIAGNESNLISLGITFSSPWCTAGGHPGLPDPIAAGAAKSERSHNGVIYDAMPVGDGITIRAHNGGTIEEYTDLACIDQVQNLDSSPGSAAPSSWLTELKTEYDWVTNLIPDPTSLTGGPGGTAPWSVAQALTRGDAAMPNTGPFRDSPGGLP